ncbi:hypothetical protein D5086_006501 [Populus alba]|uniref:Uncharacterized protein n=1 Tax=Populus alba TaxID=43335 RepID=A0ACC4CKR5_POPAL
MSTRILYREVNAEDAHLGLLTVANITVGGLVYVTDSKDFQANMNNSPMYQNYEASDHGAYEFDPQVDFTQFLEEARQHAREMNLQSILPHPESGKERVEEEKKSKRSWKQSLLKWWNAEKKTKTIVEPANSSNISNPRKGHVSGPIYGSGRGDEARHRRQTSGPLTNLFNRSKSVENKNRYVCLDQLNNPHGVKAYGPVYLVT